MGTLKPQPGLEAAHRDTGRSHGDRDAAHLGGNMELVDWERLDSLVGGNQRLEDLKPLLELFLASSGSEMAKVAAMIPSAPGVELGRALHRFRGACAAVGANRMAGLISAMEDALEQGDYAGMLPLYGELEKALRATEASMRAGLEAREGSLLS